MGGLLAPMKTRPTMSGDVLAKWNCSLCACLGLAALASLLLDPLPASAEQPPNRPSTISFPPAGTRQGRGSNGRRQGLSRDEFRAFSGAGVTAGVVKVENPNTVHILVAIAADAPLGERDVRLMMRGGISNRFRFFVGELPEINEIEPNSEKKTAAIGIAAGGG